MSAKTARKMDPRIARRMAAVRYLEHRRSAETRAALLAEREQILATLADPPEGTDLAAVSTRAAEVADALEAIARADEVRSRLGGVTLPDDDGDQGGDQGGQRGVPGGSPEGRSARDRIESLSIGQRFTGSDAWRHFGEQRSFHGNVMVEVPGEVRALLDTNTFAGQATRVPGIVTPKDRPVRLLDLLDRQTMTTSSVEYVREATETGSAAETAHGATKPEMSFTSDLITESAKTIAVFANLTRQAAADNAQVRGYIEGRLAGSLLRRLESQVLAGDGAGANIRGILNTSGTGTYTAAAGEHAVISVRKAKTVAELSEYAPDTVAMNPVDWERIELDTDTNGAFRVTPNVTGAIIPRLWALTVVTSTVMPGSTGTGGTGTGGTFLVGSFAEGATLWEREGVNVLMTDSHASNFTANILTLLLEMRAVLAVWRPAAFVEGTFSAP